MSYLKEVEINDVIMDKIKSIIEFNKRLNVNNEIYIVGDEIQFNNLNSKIGGLYKDPTPIYVEDGKAFPLI